MDRKRMIQSTLNFASNKSKKKRIIDDAEGEDTVGLQVPLPGTQSESTSNQNISLPYVPAGTAELEPNDIAIAIHETGGPIKLSDERKVYFMQHSFVPPGSDGNW